MDENPAVIYLIEGRLPRTVPDLTDLTSRYFLGVRLNCAQCHDHPFVTWKQQDFWGMAAFFTQVQTPGPAEAGLPGRREGRPRRSPWRRCKDGGASTGSCPPADVPGRRASCRPARRRRTAPRWPRG